MTLRSKKSRWRKPLQQNQKRKWSSWMRWLLRNLKRSKRARKRRHPQLKRVRTLTKNKSIRLIRKTKKF